MQSTSQEPSSTRALRKALLTSCLVALLCGSVETAKAAEGGSGVYLLGFVSPQAGLMPDPGTYLGYNFLWNQGAATIDVAASRQFSLPGTGLKSRADVDGKIKLRTDTEGYIFTLTHVFDEKILGGNAGVSVVMPYIGTDLSVKGSGVLTLSGPNGDVIDVPLGSRTDATDSDLGDMIVTGMMGWHAGSMHYITSLNLYAPTGGYDKNKAVNVGRNHWAVDPMAQVTYLDTKTGLELSGAAGLTFNTENEATHYTTGDEFHLDVAALEHLSEAFYFGIGGYAYNQVTGDSGSGALDGFEGRVFALGPMLGGAIPLGATHDIFLNARYYQEFEAKNRLEGNTLLFTAALKF